MGIKKVKDLKHPGLRIPAMEWAKALDLLDLTTREWDLAADLKAYKNLNDEQIRLVILRIRKNGWKWGQRLLEVLSKK